MKLEQKCQHKTNVTPTELAKDFHNWYEELASGFGYKTRNDTKELDFESPNGKLMLAVCERILEKYLLQIEDEKHQNTNLHNPDDIVKNHFDEWNDVTGFVQKETD